MAAADLLAVATALRDEPGFRFSELIDLCGIDYLGYGQTEWETEYRRRRRFLARRRRRRRRAASPGPSVRVPGADPRRFAAVVHLLSIEHNQRLRLRVFCEDDSCRWCRR